MLCIFCYNCKKGTVSEICIVMQIYLFLTFHQAIDSRDSVAMALYSQCFAWIIKKINSRIKGKDDFKSIGILDIFGFENFEVCSKRSPHRLRCYVLKSIGLLLCDLGLPVSEGVIFPVRLLSFSRLTVSSSSVLTMQMKNFRNISTSTFFP